MKTLSKCCGAVLEDTFNEGKRLKTIKICSQCLRLVDLNEPKTLSEKVEKPSPEVQKFVDMTKIVKEWNESGELGLDDQRIGVWAVRINKLIEETISTHNKQLEANLLRELREYRGKYPDADYNDLTGYIVGYFARPAQELLGVE